MSAVDQTEEDAAGRLKGNLASGIIATGGPTPGGNAIS